MKTTEQFEAWLSLKYGGSRLGMWMKENGEYGVPSVQLRWEAWQASRTTVEIVVPAVEKWRSVDAVRAQSAYRVLVDNAIRAAGIKVKE